MSERLDLFVTNQLQDISRSAAEKLIESGKVSINKNVVRKSSHKVNEIDTVEIDYAPGTLIVPKIELPIIYEDKSCLVIDKPAGVLTHSKGAFNPEATVATWLSSKVSGLSGDRAGIVHRLDRATSGVMIVAKNPEAVGWLQKQFSQRKAKKTYRAVVVGRPGEPEAVIDMPIERNPRKPQTFRVGSNGKSAVTNYKILKSSEKYSLIELRPTTGRTHQLRVHLSAIGHPIVGDELYKGPKADRMFLHATELELTLPNKKRQTFTVPMPETFNEVIQA
jgi:23S rRNA pseudouridine1911/1915/1917 synthase